MIRPGRHLLIGVAAGLALWVAAALPQRSRAETPAAGAEFGRWETQLERCRMVVVVEGGPPLALGGCQRLRLDQQLPGLLSVRFLAGRPEVRFSGGELVYAGVLEPGSPAMRCRQGRCEPRWPMRLLVSAVAPRGVEAGAPTWGIPQARMARGQCLLERRRVRCQAGESGGRRWEATARW